MTTINEEKLGEYFAGAFREVVLPALEDMEERLASKEDVYRLEEKLEKVIDRQDRQGKVQDELQKKVELLESAVV